MENMHAERVAQIRRMTCTNGWDAVVISGSDPHGSEYPAPRWKQVEWVSGFTGEAGDMVVTEDHAGLWTDSRYFIQAMEQLEGSGIELHRTRVPGAVGIPEWVAGHADVVAIDGKSQSMASVMEIRKALEKAHGESEKEFALLDVPDMLDRIWEDRPWIPVSPVTTLDEQDVGESRLHKIVWLRKFLMAEGYDAILLSALDDIAWTLNVRGSDITYNPLVISYLLVTLEDVVWFVRKENAGQPDTDTLDSINELRADGVTVAGYDDLALSIAEQEEGFRIFVDAATLNYSAFKMLSGGLGEDCVVSGTSPVSLRKAVKNQVEISSLREAYLEDGAAVEQFLYWLDTHIGKEPITELDIDEKLREFRSRQPLYKGESFATIAGYREHGAIVHYRATPESSRVRVRLCFLSSKSPNPTVQQAARKPPSGPGLSRCPVTSK